MARRNNDVAACILGCVAGIGIAVGAICTFEYFETARARKQRLKSLAASQAARRLAVELTTIRERQVAMTVEGIEAAINTPESERN